MRRRHLARVRPVDVLCRAVPCRAVTVLRCAVAVLCCAAPRRHDMLCEVKFVSFVLGGVEKVEKFIEIKIFAQYL